MTKNKDYLLSHLGEIKQIKYDYENEIRELDGQLDKMIEKQEQQIIEKYNKKLEIWREQRRKELQ